MARLLLDHGAKPNPADADGLTPLIYAIDKRNVDAIQTLVAHGADVNALDKQGRPPLAFLHQPLTDTDRQIQEMLIKAGADTYYERRHGVFVLSTPAMAPAKVFNAETNEFARHTLLELISIIYQAQETGISTLPDPTLPDPRLSRGRFVSHQWVVPFPDLAHIKISHLHGNTVQEVSVDADAILRSGDGSKDVWLQPGDYVDIPELEHKITDHWYGFPPSLVSNLDRCLLRTVRIVAHGKSTDVALLPGVALGYEVAGHIYTWRETITPSSPWLTNVLRGRKVDAVVNSFSLDRVVHEANVLLNTSDLSRVQVTRQGARMTCDLTASPPPEAWLRDGDVIEIPDRN